MRHALLSLLVATSLTGCQTVPSQEAILANGHVSSNLELLETWIEAQMAYGHRTGLTVAIVHDQDLIYCKGFGHADLEDGRLAGPDTIYRIASHSKLFTAIAIMQLRDRGFLDLDDPVEQHLDWFRIQDTFLEAPPITIRQLLTHTSGLPREPSDGLWTDLEFPGLEEIVDWLPDQHTVYPAQTRWKYSNLAFTLAAHIVAEVSGMPYEQYIHDRILEPLGMDSTTVLFPEGHADRLATGYGRRMPDGSRQRYAYLDVRAMAGAGGLSSSARDMAKFISWQLRLLRSGGTEVLRASTLREMQRAHWMQPPWGLGFQVLPREEGNLVGHGGGLPGHETMTLVSPSEKIGVIAYSSSGSNTNELTPYPGRPFSITDRIFQWVVPSITKALRGEDVQPDPEWIPLQGTYRDMLADHHVQVLDGKLVLLDPLAPDPKAGLLILEPAGDLIFRIEGEGFAALGETVEFELGPDGRAEAVLINKDRARRVDYGVPSTSGGPD